MTFEEGWRNKLIWGDNRLVMSSLLDQFAGKIDLDYIDPPFASRQELTRLSSFTVEKMTGPRNSPNTSPRSRRRRTATRGERDYRTYLQMMYERLALINELLTPRIA